jgi:hypothetical protein
LEEIAHFLAVEFDIDQGPGDEAERPIDSNQGAGMVPVRNGA